MFTLADYISESNQGKQRTRPQQEKSYLLPISSLDKPAAFERFEKPGDGCAFLLNEIDFIQLEKERADGKTKGVKKEHFTSFNWCLLESDEGTIEEQWNKILSLNLPLLGIVHSGNKSLHCYCHVGAKNLEEYDKRVKMLMNYCLTNGFKVDTATGNINRWVRFPYASRRDKMQYPVKACENYTTFNQWKKQSVYYLDIFNRTMRGKNASEADIELNLTSVANLLTENGYRKDTAGKTFFKVDGKLVREISPDEIHTFVYDWLKRYYPEDMEIFARSKWEPTRLKMLDSIPDKRHTDTQNECSFYFLNTAVSVTAKGIEKVAYEDKFHMVTRTGRRWHKGDWGFGPVSKKELLPGLSGFINAAQMIDHELKLGDSSGDFSRFVSLICNEDEERIKALKSAMGYLMHRYKSPSLVKAVVLTDESLTDENGGTGKGLLFQALSKMRFCQAADMKTRVQNQFFFSTVKRGCSIFHMDDVQSDFNFNSLFNVLATDMEVEGKGTNRIVIPFEEAPKIYMSTNFAFKDMQKDSYRRRMAVYELHRKFTADYQPRDEFGRNFFYDWDQEEWNRFYNFMLECSQIYMSEGLLEIEAKFAKEKTLLAEFKDREEFLDFIQSWDESGELLGRPIPNSELSEKWAAETAIPTTPSSLKRYLNRYCALQGYKINTSRTAQEKSFIITK